VARGNRARRQHPDKVELCAMAKRYVTDACFDVADQALQLHGGYGYLREYGLEKIVRDLRVHRILEGTNEIMRVVIGRAEGRPAPARRIRIGSAVSETSGSHEHVAFLGLGHMGGRWRPTSSPPAHGACFDPVPALKEPPQDKGAQVFDSGAEAVAEADVVITSLPNGDIVKAVYAEALPAARRDAVHRHLDHLGRRCPRDPRAGHERGLAQLDAPVPAG
jgi:hypothetical protein